jgi:hypothetical protein
VAISKRSESLKLIFIIIIFSLSLGEMRRERVALTDLCKLDANDLPNSHSFHLNNEWKINLKVIIDRYQSIEFVVVIQSLRSQPPIKKK